MFHPLSFYTLPSTPFSLTSYQMTRECSLLVSAAASASAVHCLELQPLVLFFCFAKLSTKLLLSHCRWQTSQFGQEYYHHHHQNTDFFFCCCFFRKSLIYAVQVVQASYYKAWLAFLFSGQNKLVESHETSWNETTTAAAVSQMKSTKKQCWTKNKKNKTQKTVFSFLWWKSVIFILNFHYFFLLGRNHRRRRINN